GRIQPEEREVRGPVATIVVHHRPFVRQVPAPGPPHPARRLLAAAKHHPLHAKVLGTIPPVEVPDRVGTEAVGVAHHHQDEGGLVGVATYSAATSGADARPMASSTPAASACRAPAPCARGGGGGTGWAGMRRVSIGGELTDWRPSGQAGKIRGAQSTRGLTLR